MEIVDGSLNNKKEGDTLEKTESKISQYGWSRIFKLLKTL